MTAIVCAIVSGLCAALNLVLFGRFVNAGRMAHAAAAIGAAILAVLIFCFCILVVVDGVRS